MKTKLNILLIVALLVVVGCGNNKKDDQKIKEANTTADELGMQREALEKFQVAVNELAKPKPDNKLALDALRRSVELEPTFAEAHYNLGLLYSQLGNNKEAEVHLQKAKDIDADVLDYTVALGRALAENERYDEAEKLFSEVVAREPQNLAAVNNLAVLSFRKGDKDVALKHLQTILREDSQNVPALTTLGQVYHKAGNLSLAKYVFESAIKVDAKNPDVHNNLGLVHMEEKNVPLAVKSFSKAIEVDPNFLESRLNLGAILLEYLDYERAGANFAEAVRIAPEHCVARLGNGASRYALGKHKEAEGDYLFYVQKCDPKHVSSYERLAKLNESFLNNPKGAIGHYQTLMTLTTDKDKTTQYKAMVNFLESQSKQQTPKTPEEAPEEEKEEGEQK